jgi:hypothetical protein
MFARAEFDLYSLLQLFQPTNFNYFLLEYSEKIQAIKKQECHSNSM